MTTAMVLFVAACGGDTEEEGTAEVASLDGGSPVLESSADAATLEGASVAEDLAPDEAALAFSQCMRDEGLDFPDLAVNAEGEIELREAFQSVDRSDESFRDAFEACNTILAQTGFGGGRREALESTEVQDALLEFSGCVRTAGFDVGDLTLGGGQGQGGQGQGGQGQGGQAPGADEANAEGQPQEGQRQGNFGNPNARFAENLGLDYEDPEVAEAIDGCSGIIEEAFSAAGLGQR